MARDRIAALCLAAGLLASCVAVPRLPVGADETQVRSALGEPALVLPDPAGGRHLAYPRGPGGTETTMARLGPDGRLVALDQALREDNFARIRRSESTEAEVLRLIGPPWRRTDFGNLGQVAWEYRFRDAWGYLADFHVMVDRRGLVASAVTVRIEPKGRD